MTIMITIATQAILSCSHSCLDAVVPSRRILSLDEFDFDCS